MELTRWQSRGADHLDGSGLDHLAKWLGGRPRSRRGVLRLGLGGGLGLLAFGRVADEALACRRNGKPCAQGNKTKQNRSCCSGTCHKGTCRPTAGAKGCTVQQDYCKGTFTPCPQNPNGYCIQLDNGKPFCAEFRVCTECTSNASCPEGMDGEYPMRPKCVKTCGLCANGGCYYPRV